MIVYSPENFDMFIDKEKLKKEITVYLTETNKEELSFFFEDIYDSTKHDISFLANIFTYFFETIHQQNSDVNNNVFNFDKIKSNLALLTELFKKCPMAAVVYCQDKNFIPLSNVNGFSFQTTSILGIYFKFAIFETDLTVLKTQFPVNKPNDAQYVSKTHQTKLNNYIEMLSEFILAIFYSNEICRNRLFSWIYHLIALNFERSKLYANKMIVSSYGFLFNTIYVLSRIFFEISKELKMNFSQFIQRVIFDVDPLFTISSKFIEFKKYERVNPDIVKEIIENEEENQNFGEFNLITRLFFICHTLINLTIKPFEDEYSRLAEQYDELISSNSINDSKFKDLFAILKSCDVYIKNNEFIKNILKINEITAMYIFSLNNQKYNINNLTNNATFDYDQFINEFFNYIDIRDNYILSLLPCFVIKNIIHCSLFVRRHFNDLLIEDMKFTKVLIYFSLIYSSYIDLLKNPHLRAEIFDIMVYFFVLSSHERNQKSIFII